MMTTATWPPARAAGPMPLPGQEPPVKDPDPFAPPAPVEDPGAPPLPRREPGDDPPIQDPERLP